MDMWRRGARLLMLMALAALLVSGAPALAGSEAQGDLATQAQTAIQQADVLIEEYAQQLASGEGDEDARDRLQEAEIELKRAESRFNSGNYEGALEHAEKVERELKQ
ncbi:MAG: hypothetical protein O6929_03445 [candidate division NC10 bacterium]|nr:hypothetical protein [candidate division NC10 bacterium]